MLSYFHEIASNGYTYSIDMLTLKGSYKPEVLADLPFPASVPFLNEFVHRLCVGGSHWEYQHYDSFTFLTYRDLWVVTTDRGVVKFFFGFRGYDSSGANSWKIQFNPNKLFPDDYLLELVRWVCRNSALPRISSFDAACDLPFARSRCFMIKDKRKYQLVMNSPEDKTEYLGCRGQSGFCKLYNKQIESKLPEPLTRFEVSAVLESDDSIMDVKSISDGLPVVWCLNDQLSFDEYSISGSDLVILRHCLECPDSFSLLGRVKGKKIKDLISQCARRVDFDFMIWIKLYYDFKGMLIDG